MRLDVFLAVSRLVKRRSAAKALAEGGAVRLGGEPAKAGRQLRVGDELEVRLGRREVRIRVLGLAQRRLSREEAHKLYEVVGEKVVEGDLDEGAFGEPVDFLRRR